MVEQHPQGQRMTFVLRIALLDDIPALEKLIPLSVRELQAAHYTPAQMEEALDTVFGVDRQLIADGTYYVTEESGHIVGCGGWSKRKSNFGGSVTRTNPDPLIDPRTEPARVRAFFIHPGYARRGMGKAILAACEKAMAAAGFKDAELVATLTGEPLYSSGGFEVFERYEIPLRDGLALPVVRMRKRLT